MIYVKWPSNVDSDNSVLPFGTSAWNVTGSVFVGLFLA